MTKRKFKWNSYRPSGSLVWGGFLPLALKNMRVTIGVKVFHDHGLLGQLYATYSHISGARILILKAGFLTYTMQVVVSCSQVSFMKPGRT